MVNSIESLLPISIDPCSQAEFIHYFKNSWQLYDWLFSSIRDEETYYATPDPLRHPLIFYWGHTAAFYINKLVLAGVLQKGLHAEFEDLFARGVDPTRPRYLAKHTHWPDLSAVQAYRDQVFQTVLQVLSNMPRSQSIGSNHPYWALLMGVEHDRIHFETSSVLIRQLPVSKLKLPVGWQYAPQGGTPPENKILFVEAGPIKIGKSDHCNLYGWDNEYGRLETHVPAFHASSNLISNKEFLEFVSSGAYHNPAYWSHAGSQWKKQTNASYPRFWLDHSNAFIYRAMFNEIEMPRAWPVEVNAYEAQAYCNWRGPEWRLLSEAEFHLIAHQKLGNDDCIFLDSYNLNLKFGSPSPVGFMQDGNRHAGFHDLFGNVWEWLQDDFYPLIGFETHSLYEDFSVPYFDSEHSMMAGAAWASTGTSASKNYRLWFRKHFFQHAGFRIARNH